MDLLWKMSGHIDRVDWINRLKNLSGDEDKVMSKIWFTSDTHFSSKRTLELSKRPFKTVEEMDNEMVKRWNEVVNKDDTVYHLGDFGKYDFADDLNGDIILLFGNYERKEIGDNIYSFMDQMSFTDIYTLPSKCIELNGNRFRLMHEPSNRTNEDNIFNLFGHIHKLQMVKKNGLNVGVDCHNFFPIDLDTVLFYKNAIEKFYDEEVFNE